MTRYEYKVVPAPQRGVKAKGVRTTEERFAHALSVLMNELGREGWEYQRSDTLPCEERVGLTRRATKFQNMLVFRRALVPQFRTSVVPEFVRAAPEGQAAAAPPPAEPAPQLAATRSGVPLRVTRRLAAALSVRAQEGKAPELRAEAPAGPAPKLGAATQSDRPQAPGARDDGPGVAAE